MPPRNAFWLAAVLAALPAAHAATTHTYPGPVCTTTLQACVNAAASGDTIELDTDSQVDELVTIRRSLTVKAATGRSPSVRALIASVDATSLRVEFNGLKGNSQLTGVLGAGGGSLDFTATGNQFTTGFNSAIELRQSTQPGTYGSLTAHIADNQLIHSRTGGACSAPVTIQSYQASPMAVTLLRNQITAVNLTECNVIDLYTDTGPFTLLAQHNILRGSGGFNSGISMRSMNAAVTAAILNNVITGQKSHAGAPAAVALTAEDANARVAAQVKHNTFAFNERGLLASPRNDLGASITGQLANNIFAHHTQYAFRLSNDQLPGFLDSYNLVFDTPPLPAGGSRPYGPGTRTGDPMFGDPLPGDFTLLPGSNAIDYGSDALADARVTTDQLGAPRKVRTVDMGAYEYQAAPPPRVRIADARVVEGAAGGTALLRFIVSLSAAPTAPVHLSWRTADGTATAPADYTSDTGTLDWAAGDGTDRTITIRVQGDNTPEPNETLRLIVESITGATATEQAIGTIASDDAPIAGAHPVPTLGPAGLVATSVLTAVLGMRRRRASARS